MKKKILVLLAAAPLALLGCSSDNSTTDGGGSDGSVADNYVPQPDTGTPDSGGNPPVPTLGAQIDRFGRPAINTALNHTFDPNTMTKNTAKDAYNADKNVAGWVTAYKKEMAGNLAILDSLDTGNVKGDGCGNQAFADKDAGADRYSTLASVLADDRQWVNTSFTTCSYLGLETGAMNDCGGRKLDQDVIKITYSATSGANGFDDGINADPAKTNGTTFPYLAAAK